MAMASSLRMCPNFPPLKNDVVGMESFELATPVQAAGALPNPNGLEPAAVTAAWPAISRSEKHQMHCPRSRASVRSRKGAALDPWREVEPVAPDAGRVGRSGVAEGTEQEIDVVARWGVWVDGRLWYGGAPTTVHARNLAHRSACTLHLEDGWQAVIADGTSQPASPPGLELGARLSTAFAEKYADRGYQPEPDAWEGPGTGGLAVFTRQGPRLVRLPQRRHPVPLHRLTRSQTRLLGPRAAIRSCATAREARDEYNASSTSDSFEASTKGSRRCECSSASS